MVRSISSRWLGFFEGRLRWALRRQVRVVGGASGSLACTACERRGLREAALVGVQAAPGLLGVEGGVEAVVNEDVPFVVATAHQANVFPNGWTADEDAEGHGFVVFNVVSSGDLCHQRVVVSEAKVLPLVVGVEDGVVGVDGRV